MTNDKALNDERMAKCSNGGFEPLKFVILFSFDFNTWSFLQRAAAQTV
jgi:hypothetical protein